ncbi:YihY/virulence factor BrkB family protein [Hydrotalea sp.]|uniref:YihY/virulence factor BrkB family protein n=1 Tax=Hydrotalea sp. TaxID=2881279 RepID=UPI0026352222|nr:YihY/virulence factor BrkB family protein [Hydrotalea sp.]
MTKFEKKLVSFPPFAFAIRKSKQIIIPGFKGIPLFYVIRFFFQQINKIGIIDRASAISFNLIMALPAAFLFIFSIIPYLPDSFDFKGQMLNLFKDLTPNSNTYKLINTLINDLLKKHVGIFSFGFILVLFYASNATMGIVRTFDKSISEKKAYFLHRRWRAIRLTTLLILLVLASLLVLIGQGELAGLLREFFHFKKKTFFPWWNTVRWAIIVLFIFFGIAFIYRFAPAIQKKWPLVSPGSILATLLMLLTTIGFSFWVNHFSSYNKVYGSIGTVLIIMLLIYLNSLILLIGFELNVSITVLQQQAEQGKAEMLAQTKNAKQLQH